jgi:outer membrane protein with beta-barrel domain
MRIRVLMVSTALFLCSAPMIQAQTMTTGLKVGIDFSSLPNAGAVIDQIVKQPSTETSAKTGALFGGFVTVPFWNRLSVQPELQFVMKGVKLNEAGGGTLTAGLRYLEFPVLLRYTVPVGEHTGYVLLGPTFGVKAGTSAHLDSPSQTADVNIDSAIRTFDGGLAFAGGFDYQRYFVELRYTQGLNDVAAEVFPHADSVKNRNIAIAAGIRFK